MLPLIDPSDPIIAVIRVLGTKGNDEKPDMPELVVSRSVTGIFLPSSEIGYGVIYGTLCIDESNLKSF